MGPMGLFQAMEAAPDTDVWRGPEARAPLASPAAPVALRQSRILRAIPADFPPKALPNGKSPIGTEIQF